MSQRKKAGAGVSVLGVRMGVVRSALVGSVERSRLLAELGMDCSGSCGLRASVEGEVADLADHVDGASGDDEAVGGVIAWAWANAAARWGRRGRGCRGRAAAARRSSTEAARGLSMGARMMWSWGRSALRIEEGEEDLGHFAEVFVAEAGEEEGAGLGLG